MIAEHSWMKSKVLPFLKRGSRFDVLTTKHPSSPRTRTERTSLRRFVSLVLILILSDIRPFFDRAFVDSWLPVHPHPHGRTLQEAFDFASHQTTLLSPLAPLRHPVPSFCL